MSNSHNQSNYTNGDQDGAIGSTGDSITNSDANVKFHGERSEPNTYGEEPDRNTSADALSGFGPQEKSQVIVLSRHREPDSRTLKREIPYYQTPSTKPIGDRKHPAIPEKIDYIRMNGDSTVEEIAAGFENIPFVDRELSWLEFNNRVLSLAHDETVPLLERVKFLSIANSNLDEFFAIRVAARMDMTEEIEEDDDDEDNDELAAANKRVMQRIIERCRASIGMMDSLYNELLEELAAKDIHILNDFDRHKVVKYYQYNIKPALAPLALDATRPIPHLKPFAIYVMLFVKSGDGNQRLGLIEIPTYLDRIVKIGKYGWYFIEDIIIANINDLYPGSECSHITAFRVIRDGDTTVSEDDKSYVESMVMNVQRRMLYNEPVRLDIWKGTNKKLVSTLTNALDIKMKNVFMIEGRLKMSDIIQLYKASDDPELKYPEFKPAEVIGSQKDILSRISKRDIIIHHPYESFNDSVLRFIREACEDPHVISIKQTLYRSGNDSKIVRYLIQAAESGKNVTVVMELKARFDEETNIEWAEKLQRAGATVVYGYEHIKTHAKLIHVFRLKGKNAEQFCHIGTGNYSEKNSKIYTDFSYFTSNKKTCSDVNNIFNMLTGGFISESIKLHNLNIAPISIRSTVYEMIDHQIALGEQGYINIKVNNISDRGVVAKLYEASNAGVKTDIICRGSCSIVTGLEGYSSNIEVVSIVGRFLEHSRVMIFGRGEEARVFITSSDLMTRNLDRRLEILFEITDPQMKDYLIEYLAIMGQDQKNAFIMNGTTYERVNGEFDSQQYLIEKSEERAKQL